jgi:hypothetical protein
MLCVGWWTLSSPGVKSCGPQHRRSALRWVDVLVGPVCEPPLRRARKLAVPRCAGSTTPCPLRFMESDGPMECIGQPIGPPEPEGELAGAARLGLRSREPSPSALAKAITIPIYDLGTAAALRSHSKAPAAQSNSPAPAEPSPRRPRHRSCGHVWIICRENLSRLFVWTAGKTFCLPWHVVASRLIICLTIGLLV